MPLQDYKDACDAVRTKGGSASNAIKSGDLAAGILAISGGGGDPVLEAFLEYKLGIANNGYFSNHINDDADITVPYVETVQNGRTYRYIGDYGCAYLGFFNPGYTPLGVVTVKAGTDTICKYAFANAKMRKLVLPASITSIESYAFQNMNYQETSNSSLLDVDMSACTNLTVVESYLFSNAKGLTSVELPPNLTVLNSGMFLQCNRLGSITIPNSVTAISNEALRGCKGITSLAIPNGVTTFGTDVFRECSNLATVNMPTSLNSIGIRAFYSCTAITSLDFPSGVGSIGTQMFYGCSALTHIVLRKSDGVVTLGNTNAFSGCNNLTNIYVPDALVDTYKTTTNWSTKASLITKLSDLPAA